MNGPAFPWRETVGLADVARFTRERPLARRLVADAPAREAIARELDLVALDRLEADLDLSAWFDGVLIEGVWRASIVQTCGVSLEVFSTELEGAFHIRAVPKTSALAPAENVEVVIDPDAEDPPDVLDGDVVDLGGYVVEQLALEIDPFPRKPGVEFEPPEPDAIPSPFAVLQTLKPSDPRE